jgi:hypothetical protein
VKVTIYKEDAVLVSCFEQRGLDSGSWLFIIYLCICIIAVNMDVTSTAICIIINGLIEVFQRFPRQLALKKTFENC